MIASESLHPVRPVRFESLGIIVEDFHCTAHVEPEGPEELNPTHSIVFVRRGLFRRAYRGESLVADPNHILFFNAAHSYRYAHPLPGGDDCTILRVTTATALELVARHSPRHAERPEAPFQLGYGLNSPYAAMLHYELLTLTRRHALRLTVEDVLAELSDQAVRSAYQVNGERWNGGSMCTEVWRRRNDLVEEAKLAINKNLEELPSLGDLAENLECSPFHLSRTFHRVIGLSLRRYVAQLRTHIAAERLAAGAPDLTELALDLGYADHSHFTNSFRKEWGLSPSRFRSIAATGKTRARSSKRMQLVVA